ncbi:hypothetical protein [uncultured Tateyamaria sp.]|uniref:hypothetical protein n=1 Tax=uncultured Tateyamaria sp. TaxID=455651 RepID=UPI00262B19CC|nr:hypothetical protein [uncultured Tateyamaria sp.]
MAHVICDIGYALSFMANHISRLSAAIFRQQARKELMTGCRDICDASGGNKNRAFPVYGKWHMQYQGYNIAYAHSETPRRPFKIVNPVSRIISEISAMPHQLSFMANGTCGISYP